ncbi:MAG: NAD(+)/NADH kinase [Anaerotruncus sp.]|nr:NAD(+)/NADH kinase [Anaerotruncus sp.]
MPNLTRPNTGELVRRLIRQLLEYGYSPMMDERYTGQFDGVEYGKFESLLIDCDLVAAVGGDGTILHCAKHALVYDKPVIGVNTGRLGYLAQIEADELQLFSRLRTGNYLLQKRMVLEVTLEGETQPYYALNDAVISKGALGRLVDLDLIGNGQPMGSYRADGIIFATPTGSTAYSLSAGGPIVDPSIGTILLTPICPHSLNDRSILFSPDMRLQVRSRFINNSDAVLLSIDGECIATLDKQRTVSIQRSKKQALFISFAEKGFHMILGSKLESRG